MTVERLFVSYERVTSTVPLTKNFEGARESVRFTGSLPLGVAEREARLARLDRTEFDAARHGRTASRTSDGSTPSLLRTHDLPQPTPEALPAF